MIDGQVVIYSNPEDLGRFGPCCRVEWRPPRGYVKLNGVSSTLRFSNEVFSNAFKAIATVP
ncbi:hypothetical protein [Desulfurococcus amylolyticus]|uniref:hypothetical protein n=1 Tax=Desulfurococcus amylolyticus TaxID=94694 RepID=UPI0005B22F20|nr:hypothetical protein [Desulfurococcus amylolyticus]